MAVSLAGTRVAVQAELSVWFEIACCLLIDCSSVGSRRWIMSGTAGTAQRHVAAWYGPGPEPDGFPVPAGLS